MNEGNDGLLSRAAKTVGTAVGKIAAKVTGASADHPEMKPEVPTQHKAATQHKARLPRKLKKALKKEPIAAAKSPSKRSARRAS